MGSRKTVVAESDRLIGRRIRTARIVAGISRRHIADVLGLSLQQIQRYEAGASVVFADVLYRIAQITGTPVSLLLHSGEKVPVEAEQTSVNNSDEGHLLQAFNGISNDRIKGQLSALIHTIACLERGLPPSATASQNHRRRGFRKPVDLSWARRSQSISQI